jgi:hypothetical protein
MGFDTKINRRTLLSSALRHLAGSGIILCPGPAYGQAYTREKEEPHFLLILFVSGGIDSTYLWDARPLSHRKAKLQTNYFASPVEPTVWEGMNGGKTLVTHLMKPLEKFREHFSILNGVMMADSFDGHEQNINLTFTGNAFGGDWFAPYMNSGSKYSLDGLTLLGNIFGDLPTNSQATIALDRSGLRALAMPNSTQDADVDHDPLMDFALSRARSIHAHSVSPDGRFTQGVDQMARGILGSSHLKKRIQGLKFTNAEGLDGIMESTTQIFSTGLSKTVALNLGNLPELRNFNFDVHGPESAKAIPENYEILIKKVANIFDILRSTPYPGTQKSYLDVTTVLMTSDFNRTTRQIGSAIDQSGTDHNPLSNTFLLGGKGIRGNMILGATDLETLSGDSYGKVSEAHKSLDPQLIKAMSKPFNIKEGNVVSTLPEVYRRTDYLTVENVMNAILKAFGVTKSEHLRTYAGDRSGIIAPSLDKILI